MSLLLDLPLSPFYWILLRHDFQVCLPVSLCLSSTGSSSVMISRFVSLSPFVSLLLDPASTEFCFVVISRSVSLLGILFRADFHICLPLSPFYWILFRNDFQVCLPLSPFYWILLRHGFQVCLPLLPFYWIQFRHDFQVCFPLCPFYWMQFRRDFQVCPPLSLSYIGSSSVVIPRFVSLCPPSIGSSSVISRFVFLCLLTGSSPIVILRLLPVCTPSTGSSSIRISRLSPFVSLLLDPVPS